VFGARVALIQDDTKFVLKETLLLATPR